MIPMRCSIAVCLMLAFFAKPLCADPIDDISAALFEKDANPIAIKQELRKCLSDVDCTSVLVLCRWRPTNAISKKYVKEVASKVHLACVWPPPPEEPPLARCIEQLCQIPSDGKNY